MHKGPIDPLLKFSVASLFPFLESWQVTRFAVFLLPYAFLLAAWKLIAQWSRPSILQILYLGSVGYLFLLVSAKEFLLVGREDSTAALFLVFLVYLSVAFSSETDWAAALHGLLWGTVGTLVTLTNWRIAPSVLVIVMFTIWRYQTAKQAASRRTLIYLGACAIASVTIVGCLLFYLFKFDLSLYWSHHFGFFTEASGWGTSDSGRGSMISFLRSLFNPYADPNRLKGGPLLLALSVYCLTPKSKETTRKAWLLLGSLVFISNAVPYYTNYNGGGSWYFIPFVIVLWFFYLTHASRLRQSQLTGLGLVLLLLLALNYRAVLVPSVKRVMSLNQAQQFLTAVRSVPANEILSEDAFFFRTSYQGDSLDSGDEVEAVYETGYYGKAFNQTVKRHFDRLQNDPPPYILTGFTQTSQLKELIAQKYSLIAQGPGNFTANAGESLKLFERKDRLPQENRT
jgi:hypothetical protein